VDEGAKLADRFGRYLRETDGDRLIVDLEDYARAKDAATGRR
jgi:hypothetical protein